MSFGSKKGEFDRFFNRLDRLVEESWPDRCRLTRPMPVDMTGFQLWFTPHVCMVALWVQRTCEWYLEMLVQLFFDLFSDVYLLSLPRLPRCQFSAATYRRVARIWIRGGYFERVRSVQTTLTRIFIALEWISHSLSENWDEISRKARKFKGFFRPKSGGLQKKKKKKGLCRNWG